MFYGKVYSNQKIQITSDVNFDQQFEIKSDQTTFTMESLILAQDER